MNVCFLPFFHEWLTRNTWSAATCVQNGISCACSEWNAGCRKSHVYVVSSTLFFRLYFLSISIEHCVLALPRSMIRFMLNARIHIMNCINPARTTLPRKVYMHKYHLCAFTCSFPSRIFVWCIVLICGAVQKNWGFRIIRPLHIG